MDEKVEPVLNGFVVPRIHRYHDLQAGRRVSLLMRRRHGGEKMTTSTMSPAPPRLKKRMAAAVLRLIRGRRCTVRHRVGFIVVGYVRWLV